MPQILKTLIVLVLLIPPILFHLFINDNLFSHKAPTFPEKKWFGHGNRPTTEDWSIRPFKVAVDIKILDDMKKRITLDLDRLTEPLDDAAFHYGVNTRALRPLLEYWRDDYNWSNTEAQLNRFPQFKVIYAIKCQNHCCLERVFSQSS